MLGMLAVSICGVALPIAAGVWLAPSAGSAERAGARQDAAAAGAGVAMAPARARRGWGWAATARAQGFPASIAPSSASPFGGNLASGS